MWASACESADCVPPTISEWNGRDYCTLTSGQSRLRFEKKKDRRVVFS